MNSDESCIMYEKKLSNKSSFEVSRRVIKIDKTFMNYNTQSK